MHTEAGSSSNPKLMAGLSLGTLRQLAHTAHSRTPFHHKPIPPNGPISCSALHSETCCLHQTALLPNRRRPDQPQLSLPPTSTGPCVIDGLQSLLPLPELKALESYTVASDVLEGTLTPHCNSWPRKRQRINQTTSPHSTTSSLVVGMDDGDLQSAAAIIVRASDLRMFAFSNFLLATTVDFFPPRS